MENPHYRDAGRRFAVPRGPVETFLQQIINGLTLGSVYALVALGYTMESGEVTLSGKASQLLSDPKVRAAYLGETAA